MKKQSQQTVLLIMLTMALFLVTIGSESVKSVQAQTGGGGTTTILVYDTSGSMDEDDVSGLTKMQAAINAGAGILSVIDAENQANLGAVNEIGVIDFSRDAWVAAQLTTNISTIQSALNSLVAGGGTAMPSGLSTALDLANGAASGSSPIIILLSDGIPNITSSGDDDEALARQETLDLASTAGTRGICVYTIGFGVPGAIGSQSGEASIDESFLQEVASRSGCGKYYNAQNALDLENVFVLSRHEFVGEIRYQGQGEISQDQQIIINTVDVPANQESLLYTLQWPGSQLDPTLFDPTGKQVDTAYPGATFTRGTTLATIIVQNPMAGRWQLGAIGVNVPEGTLRYNAALSTRPTPNTATVAPVITQPATRHPYRPTDSGLGILPFVVFVVLVAAVAMYAIKVNRDKGGKAYLQVVNDPNNARVIPLQREFIIGRAQGSSLRLADTTTSRRHARINYGNGGWFIQDMGSSGGTFVNGQRVQAKQLFNGDQVKIGQATFIFRMQ